MHGLSTGQRLREIRRSRGLSLQTVADLAGMSSATLSLIERDKAALDRRSWIEGLASALHIAPSEFGVISVPPPGDGATDAAVDAVRIAIQAVDAGAPGGIVQPVEQLTERVRTLLADKQRCLHATVGRDLPPLIRDLHSSINDGRDDAALLRLAAELHPQGTQAFLHGVGASPDLCWAAARLAVQAAERLDDEVALGVAAFGAANGQLAWGGSELAGAILARTTVSTNTDAELAGMLTLSRALVAATRNESGDVEAALDEARGLARHTGEGNAHFMSFGPTNVDQWRGSVALERGEHERAVALSEAMDPARIVAPTRRANYWINYGRALARVPRRADDAVRALAEAERISPDKLHRNPFARDVLGELVSRIRDESLGREVRGMAYRVGLPV